MSEVEYTVAGRVATIALNRPKQMNALDGAMREAIESRLREAEADAAVRVVVIAGRGRAFCAGGDLKAIRERPGDVAGHLEQAKRTIGAIRGSTKPVVARIHGPAIGAGMNLALACDLRVASTRATMGQPYLKVGLHPDWGGTYFLRRLVGDAEARRLLLTGEILSAAEARKLGLVHQVVAEGKLDAAVMVLGIQLGAVSPGAMAATKRSLFEAEREALERAMDREAAAQAERVGSAQAAEGIAAFLEKRAPKF